MTVSTIMRLDEARKEADRPRVLLINPPIRTWAKPNCFPSGLATVHAFAKIAGFNVDIWDINGDEALRGDMQAVERELRKMKPYDVYAIGGLITQIAWVEDFIWRLNQASSHYYGVVLGGALATTAPEICKNLFEINLDTYSAYLHDALILGDGEVAFGRYLVDWRKGETKRIYSYVIDPCCQEMESIPHPQYYEWATLETYIRNPIGWLNVEKWEGGERSREEMRSLNIITARGCPYNCHFCSSHYLTLGNPPYYRPYPLDYIMTEIEGLQEHFDIEYFHMNDELAFTPRRAMEFCQALKEMHLTDIYWGGAVRLDKLAEANIHYMWWHGCRHLGTGIESGSPAMLKRMNKPMNLRRVLSNIRYAQKLDMDIQFTLLIGYPGETTATLKETYDFCESNGLTPEMVFFATAYPGTVLYELAKERKLITPENEWNYLRSLDEQGFAPVLNFTKLPTEELWAWHDKLMGVER